MLDIIERKAKLDSELYTTLYYVADTGAMIFAPTNGGRGIYCELAQATLLEPPLDSVELGRRARAALIAFDTELPQDLRNRKTTDWPAYRISGKRSVRAFEHAATRVTIETINTTLRLEAWPTNNGEAFVGGFLSPAAEHSEMGALIKRLVACCQKLRAERLA
jgi:hypothetical protein